jgi:glucosamine--fructose-6-phosphate aminotransferase (isomerizing)
MCGIVGFTGKRNALPIIINGLKRLEYRGYDSAGIASLSQGQILIKKKSGKIKILESSLKKKALDGNLAIGHTRWATHGQPSNLNAHPHTDCQRNIALVHNGIIENYQVLKNKLISEGHIFKSQTDTEVIVHLIEKYYEGSLEEAVRLALKELKGSYALAIICRKEPEVIIGARSGSPLVVGLGKGENYLASDVPAILEHTKNVIYLDDFQMVSLTPDEIKITDLNGKKMMPKVSKVDWDISQAQKDGFAHFMLKEIHEQPKILRQILNKHLSEGQIKIFEEAKLSDEDLLKIKDITIVACGTAYHAGLTGKYILEELVGIPVNVDVSSEFRYRRQIIGGGTLVITVTQSGETADTLAGLREAKIYGGKVISICNVVGSSIARESDGVIYTHAGPEIGVASTKAYTAQLMIFYLLSIYLAKLGKKISQEEYLNLIQELKKIPDLAQKILDDQSLILAAAKKYYGANCFLYLARGINFPNSLEGALKLKEISYVHAEGYPAGEMKHGPIALIDHKLPSVCIVNQSKVYDKMISNIQEIKARRGIVVALATSGDEEIKNYADEVIYIPQVKELFSPLLVAIPLQLIAYYVAACRGCDIDQPRNLAKSVTVE